MKDFTSFSGRFRGAAILAGLSISLSAQALPPPRPPLSPQVTAPAPTPKSGSPYFGAVGIPVEKSADSNEHGGILVMEVEADSPAFKAGILPNDVLISFDDHPLDGVSPNKFFHLVQDVSVGTEVMIELSRKGMDLKLPVTILAKP